MNTCSSGLTPMQTSTAMRAPSSTVPKRESRAFDAQSERINAWAIPRENLVDELLDALSQSK
jgi:DNA-directed RNA polymerase specialized sigma24 family protein